MHHVCNTKQVDQLSNARRVGIARAISIYVYNVRIYLYIYIYLKLFYIQIKRFI